MRKLFGIAAVLASLSAPLAARAQLELGARLGYGLGLGKVGGSLAMTDMNRGSIPVQLDLLFALSPEAKVGGYLSYGFGVIGGDLQDSCDTAGAHCTGSVIRLGVEGTWTFPAKGTMAPWVGAGTGYEWNSVTGGGDTVTFRGWEVLNLQGGADYRFDERFTMGPFAMLTMGRYTEGSINGDGGSIVDEKLHAWLQVGIRGTFGR